VREREDGLLVESADGAGTQRRLPDGCGRLRAPQLRRLLRSRRHRARVVRLVYRGAIGVRQVVTRFRAFGNQPHYDEYCVAACSPLTPYPSMVPSTAPSQAPDASAEHGAQRCTDTFAECGTTGKPTPGVLLCV